MARDDDCACCHDSVECGAPCSSQVSTAEFIIQDTEPSAADLSATDGWAADGCVVDGRAADESSRLALRGYGGASYFHVPGESLFGAAYGLDAVYNVGGNWNLLGSFNVNHVNRGSQLVGSAGLLKIHDLVNDDPWSFSAVFDQATDSRIGGLYLGQVRAHVGYAFSDRLEIGGVFAAPTHTDPNVPFVFTFLGTDFFETSSAQMSKAVSMYAGGRIGLTQWALIAGYRDNPDTGYLAASLTRQLTDRIAWYGNGSHSWRVGNWAVTAGMEFRFGRRGGNRGRYDGGVASQGGPSDDVQVVNYVPGVPDPDGTGPDRIVLDVVDDQTPAASVVGVADRAADSLYVRNVYRPQGQAATMVTSFSAVNVGNPFFQSKANLENPFFNARIGNTTRRPNFTQP